MRSGLTNTDPGSGTYASIAGSYFAAPTLAAANAIVYTNAASVFINAAPTISTNVTITNSWAFYIASGKTYFGGDVSSYVGSNISFTHFVGNNSGNQTVTPGTGAGAGNSASQAGTDQSGIINITTGTAPAGSNAIIATIGFGTAYPVACYVTLTPANAITAALSGTTMAYVSSTSTSGFVISSGTLALASGTLYQWYYSVGGR